MIRVHIMSVCLSLALAAALGAGAANAQTNVPNLDLTATCRGEAGGTGRTNESCLRDENGAKEQLAGMWGKVPAEVRRSCQDEVKIGGSPSYVELLTCAQMNEWSKEQPNPTAPGQVRRSGIAAPRP